MPIDGLVETLADIRVKVIWSPFPWFGYIELKYKEPIRVMISSWSGMFSCLGRLY